MTANIESTETSTFSITENAAKRIAFLAEDEDYKNVMLRVSVNGGGCSGFQYKMDFDTEQNKDDHVFENGEAKVVIDEMSLEFLNGSCLDYVETLGAAAFEIKNPNATANCGCGNSFSV